MYDRLKVQKAIFFILIGRCLGGVIAEAQELPGNVVADVNGIKVVDDGPISVELGLGQKECVTGENFVLTVRFKNTTGEPVVLRGFSIETAIPYAWFSIDGGAFARHRRIHPGDLYVPSRGKAEMVLKGNDSMEFRVFLARGELVVPFKRDSSKETAIDLSIVICPVLRIVNGEDETPIAVESNTLDVTLGAPTKRQRDALQYLVDFWRMPRTDHRPVGKRYRDFLKQYPDVPYASIVRASLVATVGNELDDLKKEVFAEDNMLQDSIEFCFEKGEPFAGPLLTSHYCEFFWKSEQWSLLERAARGLADASEYDRRFHRTQAFVGMSVVRLYGQAIPDHDSDWHRKIKLALLQNLEHALVRGDEYARHIAPRILSGLANMKEWQLLKKAAALVLEESPENEEAIGAMQQARAGISKHRRGKDSR